MCFHLPAGRALAINGRTQETTRMTNDIGYIDSITNTDILRRAEKGLPPGFHDGDPLREEKDGVMVERITMIGELSERGVEIRKEVDRLDGEEEFLDWEENNRKQGYALPQEVDLDVTDFQWTIREEGRIVCAAWGSLLDSTGIDVHDTSDQVMAIDCSEFSDAEVIPMWLDLDEGPCFPLMDIVTDPEHRRKGHAKRLLQRVRSDIEALSRSPILQYIMITENAARDHRDVDQDRLRKSVREWLRSDAMKEVLPRGSNLSVE